MLTANSRYVFTRHFKMSLQNEYNHQMLVELLNEIEIRLSKVLLDTIGYIDNSNIYLPL